MAERVSALETFMHIVTYQDIVINAKSIPSNLGLKILNQEIGPLVCLGVSHPGDHIFRQCQAPLKRLRVRDKPFSKNKSRTYFAHQFCYVRAERSTRLEREGYDRVALHVVHEASV